MFRARSNPTKEEPIRQKLLFTRDAGRVYDNPGSFPISHPLGPRSVKPLGGPFLSGGSVSTYVEAEDTREKIDIVKLNAEIKEIVAREQVLRDEIDKIIAEIEVNS